MKVSETTVRPILSMCSSYQQVSSSRLNFIRWLIWIIILNWKIPELLYGSHLNMLRICTNYTANQRQVVLIRLFPLEKSTNGVNDFQLNSTEVSVCVCVFTASLLHLTQFPVELSLHATYLLSPRCPNYKCILFFLAMIKSRHKCENHPNSRGFQKFDWDR